MRFILIVLGLLLIACNTPVQPTPNSQVQSVVINPPNSNTPSSTACLPVDRVRIVSFPSALTVGASAGIDVTPRDAFGDIRSDNCNDKDGNSWDSDDTICSVAKVHEFNTTIRGVKAGTCELTACVTGHCDSVKFPVN